MSTPSPTEIPYEQYVVFFKQRLLQSPYLQFLKIEIVHMEPGEIHVKLPWDDGLEGAAGRLHGGAAASVIDAAAASAVYTDPEVAGRGWGATVNLFVNFFSNIRTGEGVVAKARVRKGGRSIFNVDVDLEGPDGRLVATGTVTYKVGTSLGTGPSAIRR